MQVICTDGTTFGCEDYALTEYGVKLLAEDRDTDDDDRYDNEPDVVGYVPHDRLWYIVPDGIRPNGPDMPAPAGQPPNTPAPNEHRSGGQMPPSGGPSTPPR